ncbi:hypothetical protein GFK82_00539 [Candidatus Steffania adelgidicola]|nr:hypothetical protein GFK82_00539 [Candidatus Steffania adelgidicola]
MTGTTSYFYNIWVLILYVFIITRLDIYILLKLYKSVTNPGSNVHKILAPVDDA